MVIDFFVETLHCPSIYRSLVIGFSFRSAVYCG